MTTIKKIGIYGGSFNPPHIAHLICAQWAYEQLNLDQLLFLPSGIPPHKNTKQTISGKFRKDMVERAISPYSYFKLEPLEVDTNKKHYTFDTITRLKEKYKDAQLYFIIGGDMVDDLHTWYRIDELVDMVQFVGMNRPYAKMNTPYHIQMIDVPLMAISSSMIRHRIKEGKSIQLLVPESVYLYIKQYQLYQ